MKGEFYALLGVIMSIVFIQYVHVYHHRHCDVDWSSLASDHRAS